MQKSFAIKTEWNSFIANDGSYVLPSQITKHSPKCKCIKIWKTEEGAKNYATPALENGFNWSIVPYAGNWA